MPEEAPGVSRTGSREREEILATSTPGLEVMSNDAHIGSARTLGFAGAGVSLRHYGDVVMATIPGGGGPSAHATTHQPGGSDAMAVDAAAGTGSLRTLGTGAVQAASGTDARFTDARTPLAHATTHQPGGSDAMAVDAAAATGSLRTLGAGATQAATGTHTHVLPAHKTTHEPGGSDVMTVDAAAGTGSLRTLGAGATQAAGGTDARFTDARTPLAHAATHQPNGAAPTIIASGAYAPGSMTVPTGTWAVFVDTFNLTGAQALTVQGTGALRGV